MDVRTQPRERVFSILNDNDCPSFVVRQQRSAPAPQPSSHARSPQQRRPSLLRQAQYKRSSSSSFSSSASDSTPPLLRFDSSSSKSSHTSMDSSPSPITPAYYNDATLLPYDNVLRQDMTGYILSPSTITPFMEQQMMIAPLADPFLAKTQAPLPPVQYPILPAPTRTDVAQLPTPTSLNSASNSVSTAAALNSNSPTNAPPAGKKNKYPCPYAQSHNCSATFTTSGHAARHGKKHTGEKGVHCPICNKAFTRKDNMKQHERTHKNSGSASNVEEPNPHRSKAALTRDAQKNKQIKKSESSGSDPTTQSSMIRSPLSEVISAAPSLEAPIPLEEQPLLYPTEPSNPVMIPVQPIPDTLSPNSLYPPITDEALLAATSTVPPPLTKKVMDMSGLPAVPMPPTLIRGYSDLDTLAQVAETFDPYYQPTI